MLQLKCFPPKHLFKIYAIDTCYIAQITIQLVNIVHFLKVLMPNVLLFYDCL